MAYMIERIERLRAFAQHISFVILMYGGRFGINLGPAVPCFACPFVTGCGGYCYLMGLQGFIGFGMSAAAAGSLWLFTALGWMVVFIVLVALLGKIWCGWLCPFGLVQDWLSALRRKLGVRERKISLQTAQYLGYVKYFFLGYLIIIPPLVTAEILPPDFYLPFCSICPGKSLLPLFVGETRYLALDYTNNITFALSLTLLIFTGITLVGMFFKERFFCIFCPLLALIHLLKPLSGLRLVKNISACTGCGNCRRICPMDIEAVYLEQKKADVQTAECLNCFQCAETCPSDAALGIDFYRFRLFSSSRSHTINTIAWLGKQK
ncbi:4Fe-4S ferredoxin [Betaproteobacteria bacterium]|nr:4Fe-4S ferredoxin [Betaproteobacteria bacterium]